MMDDKDIIEALKAVIVFLTDNEQYGDDWSREIEVLEYLLDEVTYGSMEV